MKYRHLTLKQRYQIEAFLEVGHPIDQLAKRIGCHRSTIYRELRRYRSKKCYNAERANEAARLNRRYSRKRKKIHLKMELFIRDKLHKHWSPEQIYGYCKRHKIPMASHQTIYNFIARNKQAGGKLYKLLRRKGKRRRKYGGTRYGIKNRISIDCRPEAANQRARYGDWEGDLIEGKNKKGFILTLVERKSRFTLADILQCKQADIVSKSIIKLLRPFNSVVHTITFDNGREFAYHDKISEALNTKVYFAHPYSSWERGTCENTNGLIREFVPKGSSFEKLNSQDLQDIIFSINSRPRKTLQFDSSAKCFTERPAM